MPKGSKFPFVFLDYNSHFCTNLFLYYNRHDKKLNFQIFFSFKFFLRTIIKLRFLF